MKEQYKLNCPVCQRPTRDAAFVCMPYIYGASLALIRKINPHWTRADGMCRTCIESIIDTVAELEDMKAEQCPSSVGFNQYYRYNLTKREHAQWHHCNPDMQRWRQMQVMDRIGDEALAAGYDSWLVFDVDEGLLAQGIVSDE